MAGWLKRWRWREPAPLTGAPPVRRQKTYSADSGYVYQYYYQGHRPTLEPETPATEYVFDVSADRKNSFPVSILLADEAAALWEQDHQRELSASERYAVAKMALFEAFDERENPQAMRAEVRIPAEAVGGFLETLGID